MSALAAKRAEFRDSAKSSAELLPWTLCVTDRMVLLKDGSLMTAYRLGGLDPDAADKREHDRYCALYEHTMRVTDEQSSVWCVVHRRRADLGANYPPGAPPDTVGAWANDTWKAHVTRQYLFENRHYLCLLRAPSKGTTRYFDRVGVLVNDGMSVGKAIVSAARAGLGASGVFTNEVRALEREARELERASEQFADLLAPFGPRVLAGNELKAFLHDTANPASAGQPVNIPDDAYLDTALADNQIEVGNDILTFRHAETVAAGVLSVKTWPDPTVPRLLDALLTLPYPLTCTVAFRVAPYSEAERYIKQIRGYHDALQKSWFGYIKEALTHQPSEKSNPQHTRAAKEANTALEKIRQSTFGWLNVTVAAYGENDADAEEATRRTMQLLQQRGFIAIRETMHALSAWAGTMPGQWAEPVRWALLTTENLADITFLRAAQEGLSTNAYLTEQTGKRCGAVTVFPTHFASPYYFNFHVRDLSHTLVVGPTRSGKSIFTNFLISQFRRYDGAQVFIFDKDRTCRIPTILQGGTYIELGAGKATPMNPLALLADESEHSFVADWVGGLMSGEAEGLRHADSEALWQAVQSVSKMSPELRRLSSLPPILPHDLKPKLLDWCMGGKYGAIFDNAEDEFAKGRFIAWDIGKLLRSPRLAAATLEYIFHRLMDRLDGRPTLIYVEEAWCMLGDPRFAATIEDWLRTLAKKNATLLMATQSLVELTRSSLFAIALDSIPTRIYLPNPQVDVHQALYRESFGLNDLQVDRIREALPNRDYYIVQGQAARMVNARLPKNLLSIFRSDARAQAVFDRASASGDSGWVRRYVEELSHA
jgi:type IV secretion system protein VirB4